MEKSFISDAGEKSFDKLRIFFNDFIKDNNLSLAFSAKIKIILDEIYSNIIYYSKAQNAKVDVKYEDSSLEITFMDDGVPFNPLETENPDTSLSIEDRKIGGLGIFMVKKFCNDIKYVREGNNNILHVFLKLPENK